MCVGTTLAVPTTDAWHSVATMLKTSRCQSVYPACEISNSGRESPVGIVNMLEVTSLGSGSCGNAIFVRSERAMLLVDCGVGAGPLTRGLAALGVRMDDVNAV